MSSLIVATIGFTKTDAVRFFERLLKAQIKHIVDVRLHNTSQLAGFAKATDLTYFLKKIGGIGYTHQPLLAPTDDMLTAYKKEKGDWRVYEHRFLALMAERKRGQIPSRSAGRRVFALLRRQAASLPSPLGRRVSESEVGRSSSRASPVAITPSP